MNQENAGKEGSHTRRLQGSHRGSQTGRQNRKGEIRSPARTVNMIAEVKKEGGEVKMEWIKAHMGILGNKAADELANKLRGADSRGRREVDVWGRDTV